MDHPVDYTQILGPILGMIVTGIGMAASSLLQSWSMRSQAREQHANQMALLRESHRHEDEDRARQHAEADRADRLRVIDYVELLIPRLAELATLGWLGSSRAGGGASGQFARLEPWMNTTAVDPAHPERNLSLRTAFLGFRLAAAMQMALQARWLRPLTPIQAEFLSRWERHIEPVLCSNRYPGAPILYREQLEIIANQMMVRSEATGEARPMNWREFCDLYNQDPVWKELADTVAGYLRQIFAKEGDLRERKNRECRLAIMALYLIDLCRSEGEMRWGDLEGNLWRTITRQYAHIQEKSGQPPMWYVFAPGDVGERLAATKPEPEPETAPPEPAYDAEPVDLA